ncbi:MAG TPA: PQQ-dependent sugar dehydrogenase [Gaiellaceae bacterium]|nr:PQQ-dependent sugar dehydrogenase [Gaiellaceae bacterium]
MRRRLVVAGIGLVALLGVAAGLCELVLDCNVRGGRGQDLFRGLAGSGEGETVLPPGFTQDVLAGGLELPTSLALLPDRRVLVGEKAGTVRVVEDGRLRAEPFLDISDRVATFGYRGLLAIEADPNFARNGLLYVLYVSEEAGADEESPRTVRLSRFGSDGERADALDEEVVLGGDGRGSCNDLRGGSDCIPCDGDHCGGDVRFAPDGTLMVTTGDGWNGSSGFNANTLRAQRLDTLAGKLLRVTRDGKGVPSNPFWTGDARDNRSKVWAYGLRNPFRFDLEPDGDVAWIGDVGWNRWEEVNVSSRGANFGWPCYEGPERTPEYEEHETCRALHARGRSAVRFPRLAYERGSVTGGVFYTGDAFPPAYRNAYVFGDWSRSWLRVLPEGARESRGQFATRTAGPVELAVAADGALLYVAANAGELRRIVHEGGQEGGDQAAMRR